MPDAPQDFIRCLKCGGRVSPSGVEAARLVCQKCGQNYQAVLQFIPVEPLRELKSTQELLSPNNASGSPTSDGGRKIPPKVR